MSGNGDDTVNDTVKAAGIGAGIGAVIAGVSCIIGGTILSVTGVGAVPGAGLVATGIVLAGGTAGGVTAAAVHASGQVEDPTNAGVLGGAAGGGTMGEALAARPAGKELGRACKVAGAGGIAYAGANRQVRNACF